MRVGMFGGGVVGGGVFEVVKKCTANGKFAGVGCDIEIVKICVRSLDKPREYAVARGGGASTAKRQRCESTTFVTDYDDILKDDSIDTVVEVMGGTTDAKDVILAAISAGKHVITANKAFIAEYMPELQAALKANPSVKFAFEAAVCGGIPIIHSLQSDFFSDDITKVMGIMNGTTNFMLCKMEDEGAGYDAVVKEAQRLGFAEADPTADVEGHDVRAKISIMAKLAFGKTVAIANVPTVGISSITSADFAYAQSMKSTIKLIGCAMKKTSGDLAVFVSPMVVPLSNPFATAKGPGNMVVLDSFNCAQSVLAGPGAGRFPTANSVVNDLVRVCTKQSTDPFPLFQNDDKKADAIKMDSDYESKFYMRVNCKDGVGVLGAVGLAAAQAGVSIHAVLQTPIADHDDINFVVTTETCKLSGITALADAVTLLGFCLAKPLIMPIIEA